MKKDGKVCLYQNGVIKMVFEENEDGAQIGDFTYYENGRVAFVQSYDDIWYNRNFNRVINHVNGERMEIVSHDSENLIYHGEFNKYREREGWGIAYDGKSGAMLLEGIWKKNKLVEIIRKIEGATMIEFKRNGDNTKASNRIPVYVGEFIYDELNESFIRHGRGYLIDEETRIAIRECEWKDGMEVSGRDLYDGWYSPSPDPALLSSSTLNPPISSASDPSTNQPVISISEPSKFLSISNEVSNLSIASNSCNECMELDFSKFNMLQSIEIGNNCFTSVRKFNIERLRGLKSIRIGSSSFSLVKEQNWNSEEANDTDKSFCILSCKNLQTIKIGEWSFADFAGGFTLRDLPSIQSLEIGSMKKKSNNFYFSSFTIQSMGV